jgi:hypothetical protein
MLMLMLMILILLAAGLSGKIMSKIKSMSMKSHRRASVEPDQFLRILTRQPSVPLAFRK